MRDKSKKLIYVDMDGVLADFITPFLKEKELNPEQPYPHSQYGFFMNLEPITKTTRRKVKSISFIISKLISIFVIYNQNETDFRKYSITLIAPLEC